MRRCCLAAALVLACGAWMPYACPAQGSAIENTPPAATPIPTEGFWPTKTLLSRVFDRIAETIGDSYGMDDEQRAHLRELLDSRLGTFLERNRGEIQTLLNQFLEAQFHDEPPTSDEMAQWSMRVLPLMEALQDTFADMSHSMTEVLTDDQAVRMDAEYAAFETGMRLVKAKLGDWSAGRFDPDTEWFSPGMERRRAQQREAERIQAEMDAAREAKLAEHGASADAGLPPQPGSNAPRPTTAPASQPLDEWARYTELFADRYGFDADQRQKAQLFLRAKQVERDAYLRRKAADIERITQLALSATTDDEKREARDASDRLQRPVDRMFQQLKEKLDTLPTRAQRQNAAADSQPATTTPVR